MKIKTFRNPANDYEETINSPFLCAFLFGPIYFLATRLWNHALIESLTSILLVFGVGSREPVIALISFAALLILWFGYAHLAYHLRVNYYLHKGWEAVEESAAMKVNKSVNGSSKSLR